MTGPIPRDLGRLANLEYLNLDNNDLTGPIPPELGNLASLERLVLSYNGLTGSVPDEVGRLTNLRGLYLQENDLTGRVPASLGNLVQLEDLRLGWNDLTGPIPAALGNLVRLRRLGLYRNDLAGPIPAALGSLVSLETLDVSENDLTGPIPAALGSLANLETLDISYNWGLSGPLPTGLERSSIEDLDFFVTQACAPAAWREWLATIEFYGPLCDAAPDATIDVAVVYTPAARAAAGGAAAIEAEIDLLIAETNEAYAASGVRQRLALVGRSEVPYAETHGRLDLDRLTDPSDGHLDEVHALRDRAGADVVHLVVGESGGSFYNVCGIANLPGAFGITLRDCGGITFAHELGHNMGLRHDRFQVQVLEWGVSSHPAYGYVNRHVFDAGAPQSRRWVTIMSYRRHCRLAGVSCSQLPRFSNPRHHHDGDPLGIAYGMGSGVTGPSDAAAVLDATGPAVAAWRERPAGAANRPPAAVGTLPDRRLGPVGSELAVDVSRAFVDPDGDALSYTVSSSAPWTVRAGAAAARVTLAAVGEGGATIRVAATDRGGLSVSQSFSATVEGAGNTNPRGSVESDRTALEALYDATGGTGWKNSANWKTAAPLGAWRGVTTGADGRVTEVDLYDNGLAGWLPPALGNLTRLETLRLGDDALTGPIPDALGNLANLEALSLASTELTGAIPGALGRLVNLRELDLRGNPFSSNRLSGPIPDALGNLTNLETLILDGNELTGPVPARLGNLTRLRWLSLDGNELTGSIPRALGSLANIMSLFPRREQVDRLHPGRPRQPRAPRDAVSGRERVDGLDPEGAREPGEAPSVGSLPERSHRSGPGHPGEPDEPGAAGPVLHVGPVGTASFRSGGIARLGELDFFRDPDLCAPAAWDEWLVTIEFLGPLCVKRKPEVVD